MKKVILACLGGVGFGGMMLSTHIYYKFLPANVAGLAVLFVSSLMLFGGSMQLLEWELKGGSK